MADDLDVPVIDLTALSAALYEEWGVEGSKLLFLHLQPGESPHYPNGVADNTHFQTRGATELARLIAQSIRDREYRAAPGFAGLPGLNACHKT